MWNNLDHLFFPWNLSWDLNEYVIQVSRIKKKYILGKNRTQRCKLMKRIICNLIVNIDPNQRLRTIKIIKHEDWSRNVVILIYFRFYLMWEK